MSDKDRAGFTRRWGVHWFVCRRAPWFGLGMHFDWHTPTLDLHLGRNMLQVGRNNWEGEGRFSRIVSVASGHTDQCICDNEIARLGAASDGETDK